MAREHQSVRPHLWVVVVRPETAGGGVAMHAGGSQPCGTTVEACGATAAAEGDGKGHAGGGPGCRERVSLDYSLGCWC